MRLAVQAGAYVVFLVVVLLALYQALQGAVHPLYLPIR